jgi:glycosyltransferase involved in cell wall biosynthesis
VTLLVKDLGSRSFYSGITRLGDVQSFASRPTAPHVLIATDELDDPSLAALYRGANVLVHPYRGEGFGMPIVESMACGTPVIVTGQGPAAEFCAAENSYLLPSREVAVPDPPPPLGELTGEWTWFEPDVAVLARTMRHVYENRDEARDRGRKASAAIRRTLTWERVLPKYFDAIERLTDREQLNPIGEANIPGELLHKGR